MIRHILISAMALTTLIAIVSCDECSRVECANGGECSNGRCLCPDGIERPLCVLDTCLDTDNCENGHCEYGFCVCDKYWSGKSCNVRTYRNHSGNYFGGFACNETFISTTTIEVRELNQIDTFEFYEEDLRYNYNAGFESIDRFVVPRQKVLTGTNEVFVDGNGEFMDGIISYSVHYETTYPGGSSVHTYCLFDGKKR